ncbi:MAG: CCA tRNA nucleotidyltransferase [Chloroflexi bacterium]|nr:CCA tRNA nucleotidyltransferase [Chloroflexota bacterium]
MVTRYIQHFDKLLPILGRLFDGLNIGAEEAYLVGGSVRDGILGRSIRDLDIVIRGPVAQVAKSLADSQNGTLVVLDRERQMIRVVFPTMSGLSGPTQVDLAPLTTDIEENLRSRDFTIDAMAVRLDGPTTHEPVEIIDPWGGLVDLEARVMRAVLPGVFLEDPARLVRAVRLAAELDFAIEAETQALMDRDSGLVSGVAPERTRADLYPILAVPSSYQWLRLMERLGLLKELFPELEEGRGVDQPKEHFWDVYDHNLETVRALDQLLDQGREPEDEFLSSAKWVGRFAGHFDMDFPSGCPRRSMVKLAGLLHDVAKPRSKTVEASGRIRFFGHHLLGSEMAGTALKRLRFSRRETKLVEAVVRYHLRPGQMSADGELPTSRAVYRFFRDAGEYAIDTVIVNLADYWAARGSLMEREEWDEYSNLCHYILDSGLFKPEVVQVRPLVNGHALMAEFHLSPGPMVGTLLDRIDEARGSGEIATKEEALELAATVLGVAALGATRGR